MVIAVDIARLRLTTTQRDFALTFFLRLRDNFAVSVGIVHIIVAIHKLRVT